MARNNTSGCRQNRRRQPRDGRPRPESAPRGPCRDRRARPAGHQPAQIPARPLRGAPGARPGIPLPVHHAVRLQRLHADARDRGARHRRASCRRARAISPSPMSMCSTARYWRRRSRSSHGQVDGVAVVALDHPSVREAIDDLTARGHLRGDAGFRCAAVPPRPLCRHRQHRRRTDGRHASRPLSRRPQGQGRHDRRLDRAPRPCRAPARLRAGDHRAILPA